MKLIYRTRILKSLFLFTIFAYHIPGILEADSTESGKTEILNLTEKEIGWTQENRASDWLENADRLMEELLAIDVRLYSLINTVENEKSRMVLIRQRSINRKLIYDLTAVRNTVIENTNRGQ